LNQARIPDTAKKRDVRGEIDAWFSTFDLLLDAIIAADQDGIIAFANTAAARLLGWSADELRRRGAAKGAS
jgi:PAS domain S-box-containing protein